MWNGTDESGHLDLDIDLREKKTLFFIVEYYAYLCSSFFSVAEESILTNHTLLLKGSA